MELKEINFTLLDDFIKQHNIENTGTERVFKHCKVKSGLSILITYGDELLGFFCLDFVLKSYEIKKEDYEFLRTLSNQFAIALHQAKLYNQVKKTAEKECLLKEIISELKIAQSIDEIFNYILAKLTKYF